MLDNLNNLSGPMKWSVQYTPGRGLTPTLLVGHLPSSPLRLIDASCLPYSHFMPHGLQLDECTTLWGEPDQVHMQNIEQNIEHMTVIRMWLNLRPQKFTKKYIHIHRNCESGLATIYKHAAHRLVQHMLQVVEMAWKDDSTLAISFYMCYR